MIRRLIDLPALILSAICVAETDGRPMSAGDIAFMLDVPQEDADASLGELIDNGSVTLDGDLYRFELGRAFTDAEMSSFQRLHDQLQRLGPLVNKLQPRRMHS
jgi:DNA-binding IclR family transcriptional regulator